MAKPSQPERQDGLQPEQGKDREQPKPQPKLLTVSQAARVIGVTPAQLRNWDTRGVLRVQRTGDNVANNRKLYTPDDIERARNIYVLQELDLTLGQIGEILDAPEGEREALLAQHKKQLKQKYTALQHNILLSIVADTLGLEHLRTSADILGSPHVLGDAYSKDENLQQVLRWLKSHTSRDVERFSEELLEVAEGFAELEDAADWDALQLQIGRFCDVWGSRMGWPTVGEMYGLYVTFAQTNALTEEIDASLGDGVSAMMARAFLLGWVSASLNCLDDILICLYMESLEDSSSAPARRAAEVLVAHVCDSGGRPYLAESDSVPHWGEQVAELSEAVFGTMAEAALSEELEGFLELEDFTTVDGSSLDTFQQLTCAFAEGKFDKWYKRGGQEQIERRRAEWLDCMEDEWLMERGGDADGAGATSGVSGANAVDATDDARDPEFISWLRDRFANLLADPPEACWATEDESCRIEKHVRELIEEDAREEDGSAEVSEEDASRKAAKRSNPPRTRRA